MPLFAPDLSTLVDVANSSTTPLGISGVFTGSFTDVTAFTSVTVIVFSDQPSATNGYVLQWSTDGINIDDEQRFLYAGSPSEQGKVVHATVRARFFRVRYTNSISAQTIFRLQTLLRPGPQQGSVASLGIGTSTEHDALSVNAVLHARNVSSPSTLVMPFATGDPFLIVEQPLNRTTISERTIVASTLFSQALDLFGVFGGTRRWFSVYNDTIRGNLYIRLGSAATTVLYFWKVPARHTWQLPLGWGDYSGAINGIWDVADGSARTLEHF